MKRVFFIIIWIAGLMLLIYLLRFPFPTFWQQTSVTMPLANQVIVIDPGHGGVDGGADYRDIYEKTITLDTAFYLRDYLQEAGAMVYLTREKDIDLAPSDMRGYSKRKSYDIRRRVSFVKEKEADLFISLHLNSLNDSRWRGAQTFFYPGEENEKLARAIQERMREISNTNRTALATERIYIIKNVETTGALVEMGFLSNAEDRNNLIQEDYQREIAFGISQGIIEYVASKNTP